MCTISLLTLPAGNLAGQRMVNGGRRDGSILVPRPARYLAPVSDVQLGLLRRHIYGSGVPGLIGGPLGAHIKLCRTMSANDTCEDPRATARPYRTIAAHRHRIISTRVLHSRKIMR
jgi:hypothetical protein